MIVAFDHPNLAGKMLLGSNAIVDVITADDVFRGCRVVEFRLGPGKARLMVSYPHLSASPETLGFPITDVVAIRVTDLFD